MCLCPGGGQLHGRSVRTSRIVTATVGVAALLAACSSGSGTAAPAGAPTGATTAGPTGPCDADSLASHAGVAAGTMKVYVWGPYQKGLLAARAARRAEALRTAAAAAGRVDTELSAVSAVEGCRTSVSVTSAVTTAASLARSVQAQLAKGSVNPEAIGGLNSAVTTVVQQTREAGAKVIVTVPPVADLTTA